MNQVIDRDWALAQIGDDSELFADIATVFLSDSPALRVQLEHALAQGAPAQIQHVAHTIKSAVGNFGATRATAAARTLEEAARCGEGDFAALAALLLGELIAVEEALRPYGR